MSVARESKQYIFFPSGMKIIGWKNYFAIFLIHSQLTVESQYVDSHFLTQIYIYQVDLGDNNFFMKLPEKRYTFFIIGHRDNFSNVLEIHQLVLTSLGFLGLLGQNFIFFTNIYSVCVFSVIFLSRIYAVNGSVGRPQRYSFLLPGYHIFFFFFNLLFFSSCLPQ